MHYIQMYAVRHLFHQTPAFGGATSAYKVDDMLELVHDVQFF